MHTLTTSRAIHFTAAVLAVVLAAVLASASAADSD